MTLTMHQASVPPIAHSLRSLIAVLRKAAAHAEARSIDPAALLQARLYPDMFPLVRQVQIVSDIARRGMARLAQIDPPVMEDTETGFEELIARLEGTIAYIRSFSADQIDGSEEQEISLPVRDETLYFDGKTFLLYFVLPNLYFHVTTAYAILRHNGVELGKRDFLGDP